MNKFQILIAEIRYIDFCTIVVKLRQSSKATIQTQIATLLVKYLENINPLHSLKLQSTYIKKNRLTKLSIQTNK